MNQATIRGRAYDVAESFNELTGRQLVAVAGLLYGGLDGWALLFQLLLVLLQTKRRLRLQWDLLRIRPDSAAELLPLTNWLFGANTLTRQLLPTLLPTWWGPRLFGPADRLQKLTFGEWIDAEQAFHDYRQHGRGHDLTRLVAVLYRPRRRRRPAAADDNGDPREAYNNHRLPARQAQVARLPRPVLLAVMLFYAGCRAALLTPYQATIFREDESKKGKPEPPQRVYLKVLRELATAPQHYDAVGRQPLSNILFEVDARIRRNDEREAELRRAQAERG